MKFLIACLFKMEEVFYEKTILPWILTVYKKNNSKRKSH